MTGAPVSVRRGGAYNRLAEPSWRDPLDTGHSRGAGGRWNPPGAFGALYLNADERLARLQVAYKLAGQPYDIEDLDPVEQHDLVDVHVDGCAALDCVTPRGLQAVGLPAGYPLDAAARTVAHAACQPIGAAARAAGLEAVACRSAAGGAGVSDEELAVFEDAAPRRCRVTARRAFSDWY